MQWYDYLRITTALLAVIAAYRLARLVQKDHHSYTSRLAEFIWIQFAVYFTLFAGALEAIIAMNTWRYGALLSFFIAAAAVRATRDGGPLQCFDNDEDYTACGYRIFLNNRVVAYCDKEIVMEDGVRTHADKHSIHHVSILFDDDRMIQS